MPEKKRVIVLLFCGSGLNETLTDIITEVMRALDPAERGKSWEHFSGTGCGGNSLERVIGLVHGQIGKNTCYDAAHKAIQFLLKQTNQNDAFNVITIAYSRGFSAARLTAEHASQHEQLAGHRFTHLHIDPVLGPFGNTAMTPAMIHNTDKAIHFYAEHGMPFPLFPLLFPAISHSRNKKTIQHHYALPVDHAGIGGVHVTPFNAEQSALSGKNADHFRKPIVALILYALKMSNVVDAPHINAEMIVNLWLEWHDQNKWQPSFFHPRNYARRHDQNTAFFSCVATMLLSTVYALNYRSMQNFILLSMIYCAMIYLLRANQIILPISALATSILPEKHFPKNKAKEHIQEQLNNYFSLFDHCRLPAQSHQTRPEMMQ
jgi:hypothetical protein